MAYIVDFAITESAAGGAVSVVANVPEHQANDYLIMFGAVNGLGVPSVTGWTQIGTSQTANSGITSAVWYFKATTATTTCTVAISAADDYSIKIISVRDAHLTTFLAGTAISTNSGTTAADSWTSPTMTTTSADALIIYYHALDGITPMAHSNAGTMFLTSSDSTGTTANTSAGSAICWYIQRTAGVTPAASWNASISTQRTNHVFAIQNVAGGVIPPYIDDSTTQATLLHPGFNIGTLNNTTVTSTMTATASINAKTMGTTTAALGADFGINPYSSAIGNASAIVATNNLNGYQITLTGGRNLATGLVIGNYIARTPKEAKYGIGSTKQGGLVVRLGSAAGAWNSYQVGSKDAQQSLEGRSVFAIQAGYTASAYGATQGTAVTTSAVSFIQFYYNAPLFASIVYLSELYQVFNTVIAGGTAAVPVDIDGLTAIGNSYRLPLIRKTGSAVLSYTPIQIGGGDAVNFQVNLGTIQFPERYNAAGRELSYHAANNTLGISFSAKTGDVCNLTNSVVTSPTSYYFTINAAATAAATWDFRGSTIVGANVTLRPVTTFTNMIFSGSTGFTTNASSLSGCTITSSIEVVAGGSSFSECVFSNTTATTGCISITGASQAALQTELNKFTNSCTFSSNTIGPALRIIYTGTAGPISLSLASTLFSANTTDIRWEAPIGSNLTLNLTGTSNPSTYSATNSNTVAFINAKSLTITGLLTGSDIVIKTSDTNTALVNIDQNVGTTYVYSYNYAPSTFVDIKIQLAGQKPVQIYDYLLANADSSLPIAQEIDRAYQ